MQPDPPVLRLSSWDELERGRWVRKRSLCNQHEVTEWLESDEGVEWSRARSAASTTSGAPWMGAPLGSQDASEDPCGRPPIGTEDAATGLREA